MSDPVEPAVTVSPASRTATLLRVLRWRDITGQFVLTVLGVLAGLAVSNWNAEREARKSEAFVLRTLRVSVANDLKAIRSANTDFHAREPRIAALIAHMEAGRPWHDSLKVGFGAVYGNRAMRVNRAPYEELKGRGLSLVQNDSLRGAIVNLYEQMYARIAAVQDLESEIMANVLRPYYLREFHDLAFRSSATPWDYDALQRDRYFRNVLHYRHTVLKVNQIAITDEAIPVMETLLRQLDVVLKDR